MLRRLISCLAVLALTVTVSAAHAQTMKSGSWIGGLVLPNGARVPVTFDVAVSDDSIAITLHETQMGAFPFREIRLDGDRLQFIWSPGEDVTCDLTRGDDGRFEGPCTDGQETGKMIMIPPESGPAHDTRH